MKLTPYLVAIVALILLSVSAAAQDIIIENWRVIRETKTTQSGSPSTTEIEASFEPTDVDPTTGDFVVTCVDGEQEIHLTIPPWGWEDNPLGGWSTISNDPNLNGATLIVIDDGMQEEVSLDAVEANVDSAEGATIHLDGPSGPIDGIDTCSAATLPDVGLVLLKIGSSSGFVMGTDNGISNIEFEYLPVVAPQIGFIELKDEWRIERDEQGVDIEIRTSARMATGEVQIDPMQDGVAITWGDDNGSLVFRTQPWAFKKRFFSSDLKDFQWQLNDDVPLDQLGIEFFFEDGLGNRTDVGVSVADIEVRPNSSSGLGLTVIVGIEDTAGNTSEAFGNYYRRIDLVSGGFAAGWDAIDPGTVLQELKVEPNIDGTDMEICNNGFDDDGDGLIDFLDPDCNVDPL
jgi:hypothetical protein